MTLMFQPPFLIISLTTPSEMLLLVLLSVTFLRGPSPCKVLFHTCTTKHVIVTDGAMDLNALLYIAH